ncbi:MAG: response regulator, partial [Pseudomonadota bacterium]
RCWEEQPFDIILMDVQMPIMSGPEATVEIRKLELANKRKRTPIIALTANAMTHHVQECLASGMDAHVAKPIRPDLLFAAIDKFVGGDEDEKVGDVSSAAAA